MATITLKNITKKFDAVLAVDRFDLTVEDKEFLVLVGSSGCGKTTTLRMIAGLEDITEGDIYIGDQKINNLQPKDRHIAMVFQNYALYPHMNVYKNMSFGLRLKKFPKDEIDARVLEAAKILGIEDLLKRKPKELSGGQRQRVAMGRAIVRKPQAFLFDEPLSNLDAKLRVQMRGELAKLHDRLQTTVVYVTHDQIEAMTLASRIVVMNEGRILQVGSPMEVYANPNSLFVAGFIGSPAMNFFDVHLIEENGSLILKGDNIGLPLPKSFYERYGKLKNQETTLGVRPQNIHDKAIRGSFPGGETLSVMVDVVEPIGSEVILLTSCGSTQITICADPRTDARVHVEKEFLVDMNRIHLFDKKTGAVY
ncbi:ABC transporter ATP-binding protein [Thermodesulfobacteriota bacterium]